MLPRPAMFLQTTERPDGNINTLSPNVFLAGFLRLLRLPSVFQWTSIIVPGTVLLSLTSTLTEQEMLTGMAGCQRCRMRLKGTSLEA